MSAPNQLVPTRRQFLLAVASTFVVDRGSESWSHETGPDAETVAWKASDALGPVGVSLIVPVWLRGEQLSTEREGSEPALALLFYQSEPAPPQWWPQPPSSPRVNKVEWTGDNFVWGHIYETARAVPGFVRVVRAASGEVVFTSELPEAVLRPARQVIDRSPTTEVRFVQVACPDLSASVLYKTNLPAPITPYFTGKGLTVDVAINYRAFLQRSPEMVALISQLNPDYLAWFWRIVAQVPPLPEPDKMCRDPERGSWIRWYRSREILEEP